MKWEPLPSSTSETQGARDIWRVKARFESLGYFVRSWVSLLNASKVGADVADLGSL